MYKDLRISRKDVLKTVREHMDISMYRCFSDQRKAHQRVKWYGCRADVTQIQEILNTFNYDDVKVYKHSSYVSAIVFEFPYSDYK